MSQQGWVGLGWVGLGWFDKSDKCPAARAPPESYSVLFDIVILCLLKRVARLTSLLHVQRPYSNSPHPTDAPTACLHPKEPHVQRHYPTYHPTHSPTPPHRRHGDQSQRRLRPADRPLSPPPPLRRITPSGAARRGLPLATPLFFTGALLGGRRLGAVTACAPKTPT